MQHKHFQLQRFLERRAPISVDPEGLQNFYKPTSFIYENDVLGKSIDVATWRSVGNQKILVVPVKFTNSPIYGGDAEIKANLQKTFFGQSADTGWESLASFYEKSSYGKLKISGEVLDPHVMNYDTGTLETKEENENYWDPTHYVLESIYDTLPAAKLKEYDLNNDGHVDAIFMVYLAPTSGDVFWAYQYYWTVIQTQRNQHLIHMLGQVMNLLMRKVAILL